MENLAKGHLSPELAPGTMHDDFIFLSGHNLCFKPACLPTIFARSYPGISSGQSVINFRPKIAWNILLS
jgi:hypothetical protein